MRVPIAVAEKAYLLCQKLIGTVNAADSSQSLHSFSVSWINDFESDIDLDFGFTKSHIAVTEGVCYQSREIVDYSELLDLLAPYAAVA